MAKAPGDLWLNLGLGLVVVLLAVLAYGFASRSLTPRTTPTRDGELGRIQVEVRNGAGVDGLAAEATDYLRRRGFDVVEIGNAPRRDTTAVLVRSGTALDARHVAQALGLGPDRIVTGGPTSDYALDVTVTVGTDYRALTPFSDD